MRHDCSMARPRTGASALGRSRAIGTRGGTELPPESPREDLVAVKANLPRNCSYLSTARQKLAGGALKPQAQRILLGCFTEKSSKGPMEMERGPPGMPGQGPEAFGSDYQILNDA
jgi:hypothetical protein